MLNKLWGRRCSQARLLRLHNLALATSDLPSWNLPLGVECAGSQEGGVGLDFSTGQLISTGDRPASRPQRKDVVTAFPGRPLLL